MVETNDNDDNEDGDNEDDDKDGKRRMRVKFFRIVKQNGKLPIYEQS